MMVSWENPLCIQILPVFVKFQVLSFPLVSLVPSFNHEQPTRSWVEAERFILVFLLPTTAHLWAS